MQFTLSTALTVAGLAATVAADAVSVTPHQQFSSSVGVLGCHINTNRVAYWPGAVDCNNLCVKLTHASGRTVNVLRIDSSGGAHDISYDAWNYLSTGKSATEDPTQGGGIPVTWQNVDMAQCDDLINTPGHKLPLMAANSMNFVAGCPASSWVGANHLLYNIGDSSCRYGYDEVCTMPNNGGNQATCPHTLGLMTPLTTAPVYDIEYGTGKKVLSLA